MGYLLDLGVAGFSALFWQRMTQPWGEAESCFCPLSWDGRPGTTAGCWSTAGSRVCHRVGQPVAGRTLFGTSELRTWNKSTEGESFTNSVFTCLDRAPLAMPLPTIEKNVLSVFSTSVFTIPWPSFIFKRKVRCKMKIKRNHNFSTKNEKMKVTKKVEYYFQWKNWWSSFVSYHLKGSNVNYLKNGLCRSSLKTRGDEIW